MTESPHEILDYLRRSGYPDLHLRPERPVEVLEAGQAALLHTDQGKFVARVAQKPQLLTSRETQAFQKYLHAHGVAVPKPVGDSFVLQGEFLGHRGRSCELSEYIEGRAPEKSGQGKLHRAIGEVLAAFHMAALHYTLTPSDTPEHTARLLKRRAQENALIFARSHVQAARMSDSNTSTLFVGRSTAQIGVGKIPRRRTQNFIRTGLVYGDMRPRAFVIRHDGKPFLVDFRQVHLSPWIDELAHYLYANLLHEVIGGWQLDRAAAMDFIQGYHAVAGLNYYEAKGITQRLLHHAQQHSQDATLLASVEALGRTLDVAAELGLKKPTAKD